MRRCRASALGRGGPSSIIANLRLSLILIVPAVSVITSAFVLVNEAAKTKGDFEAKAETSVRYLGSILESPLWNFDEATVAIIGDALFRDEDIVGQLSSMMKLNAEMEESTHEKDELILELRARPSRTRKSASSPGIPGSSRSAARRGPSISGVGPACLPSWST